ncbi:MAG: hypothetical protein ACRDPW_02990 [Mycobacteriales bacterium]
MFELNGELSVDDEEHLVVASMVVPSQLTQELGDLDVLVVNLADDLRVQCSVTLESASSMFSGFAAVVMAAFRE